MNIAHFSEDQLQEMADNRYRFTEQERLHLAGCSLCAVKINAYRDIIHAIEQQPREQFDFDLSSLVLQSLPESPQPSKEFGFLPLLLLPVLVFAAAALFYFWQYVSALFDDIGPWLIILAVISVLLAGIFIGIDMYTSFRKKMRLLDIN